MRSIIIVAGGKGMRMGADIPKQFIPINGKPILMHTLANFHKFDDAMQIVLVLPPSMQNYWMELCKEYNFSIPYTLADGGETRFHSVLNGIACVNPDCTLIGVHDGVRPFVSHEVIRSCYAAAEAHGAAIPVIDVVETVRLLTPDGSSVTVPRNDYKLVQTPQVFSAPLLRNAYSQQFTEAFTDDASVVEAYGHGITLVEGNRENIKITTPYDLKVADALLD